MEVCNKTYKRRGRKIVDKMYQKISRRNAMSIFHSIVEESSSSDNHDRNDDSFAADINSDNNWDSSSVRSIKTLSSIAEEPQSDCSNDDSMHDGSDKMSNEQRGSDDSSSKRQENEEEPTCNEMSNEQREEYVLHQIREWSRKGVTKAKVDELLQRLKPVIKNLPLSHKTLLKTPRRSVVVELGNGKLWYKGIMTNLHSLLDNEYFERNSSVSIDINIDGLPLHNSTKYSFWPILGRLRNSRRNRPFIIAIWFGEAKCYDLNFFLGEYVLEVQNLFDEGVPYNGENFPFRVVNYILDAPARAYVKGCIGHGGTHACEKCCVEGEWIDSRMTFNTLDAPLRTDESFRNREQPAHHNIVEPTPLELLDTGMISQFRLDSLHLAWEGAFKRLLHVWLNWRGSFKLDALTVAAISSDIKDLDLFLASDFNRRPRGLQYVALYKGTEYRRIALYDGIKVFKRLDRNIYKNYLLFHSAMYILSSQEHVETLVNEAEKFLIAFVEHAAAIYGKKFVVYNIHSLIHLADECRLHGSLDQFSAFPYENFFGSIKDVLTSSYKPLEQLINRDSEGCWGIEDVDHSSKKIILSLPHTNQDELVGGSQFQFLLYNGLKFRLGLKDSCCKTIRDEIVVIRNFIQRPNGEIILRGQKLMQRDDVYT